MRRRVVLEATDFGRAATVLEPRRTDIVEENAQDIGDTTIAKEIDSAGQYLLFRWRGRKGSFVGRRYAKDFSNTNQRIRPRLPQDTHRLPGGGVFGMNHAIHHEGPHHGERSKGTANGKLGRGRDANASFGQSGIQDGTNRIAKCQDGESISIVHTGGVQHAIGFAHDCALDNKRGCHLGVGNGKGENQNADPKNSHHTTCFDVSSKDSLVGGKQRPTGLGLHVARCAQEERHESCPQHDDTHGVGICHIALCEDGGAKASNQRSHINAHVKGDIV
mmetsp:Transcript_8806/g.14632  ORF Transcript_8806/g.14632 Transcript_8806/m.14632 type:complete len:276 (+) Transcript_8806:522-1349(+)